MGEGSAPWLADEHTSTSMHSKMANTVNLAFIEVLQSTGGDIKMLSLLGRATPGVCI